MIFLRRNQCKAVISLFFLFLIDGFSIPHLYSLSQLLAIFLFSFSSPPPLFWQPHHYITIYWLFSGIERMWISFLCVPIAQTFISIPFSCSSTASVLLFSPLRFSYISLLVTFPPTTLSWTPSLGIPLSRLKARCVGLILMAD